MNVSINWGRNNLFSNIKAEIILEVFKSKHLRAYEKQYWRLSAYERIIREDHLFPWQIVNVLWQTKRLQEEMRKVCCKKRVIVKADIPPSIIEETVLWFLQKTDLKWTHFQRKVILTKNDLKLRLNFARKFVINVQCLWNRQKTYSTRENRSHFA